MRKDIAQAWVDALRAGDKEQAKGMLGKISLDTGKVSYCCLGVLCEVAITKGLEIDRSVFADRIEFDGVGGMPTPRVNEFVGAVDHSGINDPWMLPLTEDTRKTLVEKGQEHRICVEEGDPFIGLADLNDSGVFTFAEIADVIESAFLKETI